MLKRVTRRIVIALVALLAVLGTAGIVCVYQELSQLSEREVLTSLSRAIRQTAININAHTASVAEAMQTLLYDVRFQESAQRTAQEDTLENQLAEIRPLRELVNHIESNRNIAQVRVYMNDRKMLTREGINFFGLPEAVQTAEYEALAKYRIGYCWMGQHRVKTRYFDQDCLTLGALYNHSLSSGDGEWAMVLLDVPVEQFARILKELEMPQENTVVVISDAMGKTMLGNADTALLAKVQAESMATRTDCGFFQDEQGDEWAWVEQALEVANWSICAYMPRSSLLSGEKTVRSILTMLLLGLTLLMFALLVISSMAVYSRSVSEYIRALHKSLKASAMGETQRLPAHRALFSMDQSIAELLKTNKQLAEEKLSAQLREREVTLQALQAQINPHFLYNTLDSINWMAIRENATDVSEAITNLADYFRISLSRGRSVVTLAEDAEIARKYLALYERRYDYAYQVVWMLNDDTLRCTLPKLTLQPLLENALQHGIFKRKGKTGGMVHVHAVLEGEQLVLTVCDNGPGLEGEIDWHEGYGLGNVRRRLDLYFNNRYTLSFESAPEGGAAVTVRVNAQEQTGANPPPA